MAIDNKSLKVRIADKNSVEAKILELEYAILVAVRKFEMECGFQVGPEIVVTRDYTDVKSIIIPIRLRYIPE